VYLGRSPREGRWTEPDAPWRPPSEEVKVERGRGGGSHTQPIVGGEKPEPGGEKDA
jgi:hypothetical protein